MSGRIDLTQAEAVHDLIEAQTLYQARVAAQQLHGALSRRIKPIKEGLVALIALLEAGIDFAEDDVDVLPGGEILSRIEEIRSLLQPVADSFARGRIVHAGLMLAIVGRPNAGKSSLFNRIVQRERAIVTAAPGTTRDLVTERVSLGGIPVELVDTAGMREASDEAEQIGIRKSREALADADMVLMVLDATAAPGQEELELLATLAQRRALVVVNKSDLAHPSAAMEEALGGLGLPVVHTSALSGRRSGRAEAEDAGDGRRPHGGDGEWHADQPAPIPGGNGNAGSLAAAGVGGRTKHSARDGAAGSVRSAPSSRFAHRRDHQRRHPESDLLYLLYWKVEPEGSMFRPTLRLLLGVLLPLAAAATRPAYPADQTCDRIFRLRAESLDELLHSAQDARQRGVLPTSAYVPTVDWLFAQEQQLYIDARAHHFEDVTEATYWQRSRLKFPSSIDQQHDAVHASR